MVDLETTVKLRYVEPAEIQRLLAVGERYRRAQLFALAARINILYMICRAGSGHPGTSLSSIDVMTWLYLEELRSAYEPDGDVFFSSKGHDAPALYAVLLGLGVLGFDEIHRLRRLGGLPGHPDVSTAGVRTNTGSLGMGLSKAKGMIRADRLLGRSRRYVILTGDGELQEGQIWESLRSLPTEELGELTVVVDYNRIQSDTWVADVGDLGDLGWKLSSFGLHVEQCDGHSFEALADAFGRAAGPQAPKAIIAHTVKGAGARALSADAMPPGEWRYPYHSGALDPDTYADAVQELVAALEAGCAAAGMEPVDVASAPDTYSRRRPAATSLVAAYSQALVERARMHPQIVVLDADLAVDTGLVAFREEFPERFIECGIAEQDMVSQAGGLALAGFIPIVHSFAAFLTSRANEQIYNNATELTKVIYVGSLAGVVPAGPGHSHQATRDIATLAAVPGMTIIEPATAAEVAEALGYCIEEAVGPCYLRLVSVPIALPAVATSAWGRGRGTVVVDGDDAALITYGPVTLREAIMAAGMMRERDVSLRVVALPWINDIDAAWLTSVVADVQHVVCVENHAARGGQADRIAAILALAGDIDVDLVTIGADGIPVCGEDERALHAHGLDARALAAKIGERLPTVPRA